MSDEEKKAPGGENIQKVEEQNPPKAQPSQPEEQPEQEKTQNNNQNQLIENQPAQVQQEEAQEEDQQWASQEPQENEEKGETTIKDPEKKEEQRKINHFSRRAHQEMTDNQEGEGGESPANEMEEEEDEEGEEGEDIGNSSDRKDNYNSKELEDFLAICDHVVKPLEQKDLITRSLNNFQNNIKNSLDQIDKNFTLQRIDLPNQPNKDIAKDSQSVRALEEVVKKYTEMPHPYS